MSKSREQRFQSSLIAFAFLAAVSVPAWAVDGIVLIDQNKALAGGATPGDAPGFPITISLPGSYRLSGTLIVPDANTTAIEITADNVTLDLNGFAILGPVDCSQGFPCANIGAQTGYGILAGTDAPVKGYRNITVRNGTIGGMGADGVHLLGDSIRLEDLHIRDNGFSGLVVRGPGGVATTQSNLIVYHNNIQRNGSYGIKADAGVITDNAVSESRNTGIWVDVGAAVVARNLVSGSGEFGLLLTSGVSYFGNTLVGNNGVGAQVAGGINTGQNVCQNAICPGAQF